MKSLIILCIGIVLGTWMVSRFLPVLPHAYWAKGNATVEDMEKDKTYCDNIVSQSRLYSSVVPGYKVVSEGDCLKSMGWVLVKE